MSQKTKQLTVCALSVALATAASMIRLFRFPFGGSVTLCCMLFIFLPSWIYGYKAGIICGLIYGLLQFVTGPYFMNIPQFLFDYIFSFAFMGLGGLLRSRKNGLLEGYILAATLRWIMASIAGLIWINLGSTVWDGWAPLPYTLCYNFCYIFAEAVITIAIMNIPAVKKALLYAKHSVNPE